MDAVGLVVDVAVLLLAGVFTPAMLWDMQARSRTRRGMPTPLSYELARMAWGRMQPYAAILAWLFLRLFQPKVARPFPAPDDIAYVEVEAVEEAEEAADGRPSEASAPSDPKPDITIPPGDRRAVVRLLVAHGWQTMHIRATLKGANDEIGREVEEARQSLRLPRRKVMIGGGKLGEVEL